VADPGTSCHIAQSKLRSTFLGKDFYAGMDQSIFQIPMVIILFRHRRIIQENLDIVKLGLYDIT
jgi:hypothetical protein